MIKYHKVIHNVAVVQAVAVLMADQNTGTPKQRWKKQYQAERLLTKLRTRCNFANSLNPTTSNKDNS